MLSLTLIVLTVVNFWKQEVILDAGYTKIQAPNLGSETCIGSLVQQDFLSLLS